MDWFPLSAREALARILIVVLVLLVLWLLVRLLVRILTIPLRRLLERVNYSTPEDTVNTLVRGPARYLFFAMALTATRIVLDLDLEPSIFLNRLSVTLVIIAVGLFLLHLISFFFFTSAQLRKVTGFNIDDVLLPFLKTTLKLTTIAVAALFVLQAWGVDVGALIAGLGIAGLAVSLAAQDTIANVFGFVVIIADRPFVVGEWVKTPDCDGEVEEVRLRSTRVRQMDQSLVIVPNSKMASASVVNWSRLGKRLINVTFGITSTTSPDALNDMLRRLRGALLEFPSVEQSSVQVHFVNIGAQSLEVLVRAYVLLPKVGEFRVAQERILLALKREVDSSNLTISGPSQTLYIQNMENLVSGAARPEPPPPPVDAVGKGDPS